MKLHYFVKGLLLTISLFGLAIPAQASPAKQTTVPVPVVQESFSAWHINHGLVYWGDGCIYIPRPAPNTTDTSTEEKTVSVAPPTKLQRKPTQGGATRTLINTTNCKTFNYLLTDESGVYYHDSFTNQIEHVPLNPPNAPAQVLPNTNFTVSAMQSDTNYLYFATTDHKIRRLSKSNGTVQILLNTTGNVDDMVIDAGNVYWSDTAGLHWAPITCDSLPCVGSRITTARGNRLVLGSAQFFGDPRQIYFVDFATFPQRLRRLECNPVGGCTSATLYTAADNWLIGQFVVITLKTGVLLPNGPTHLFWLERNNGANEGRLLRRKINTTDTPDELHTANASLRLQLLADNDGVYFAKQVSNTDTLFHLPFNATAITRDFQPASWEITQAIQNLANDVPLIADKPTYVRLYGQQVSGPRASAVEATLAGSKNGNTLPGSPLRPINGTLALATNSTYDRANIDDGWLFKLPASWLKAGDISLQAQVNPRQTYADTNNLNDVLAATFNFDNEPNACMFVWPVETKPNAPSINDPNVWETIDHFNKVWPVASTKVVWMGEPIRELEFCSKWGVPYPCYGPYELDQGSSITNFPSDSDRVIGKLILRQIEAQILAIPLCELGASVHSVGMVHPQAKTKGAGYANLFFNASWTKFPSHTDVPSNPLWEWPRRGSTLAQELTHNFWRKHVNCGNPPDVDGGYPYPPCQLDNAGAANYYGFDVNSLSPIPPTIASDYMSYRPDSSEAPNWQGRWVSDYTYRAVKSENLLRQTSPAAAQPWQTRLADAAEMVTISGAVEPNNRLGALNHAFVQATAAQSRGAMDVWQRYLAAPWQAHGHPQSEDTLHQDDAFHVRLKDASGTILADRVVSLLEPDHHGDTLAAFPFLIAFPAPVDPVAKIELLVDAQLLDAVDLGVNPPIVSILSPSNGDLLGGSLTIRWQASDPDPADMLLYHIHYSPDDGVTWLPLALEQPGTPGSTTHELTLDDPAAIPGSQGQQARIRIMVSDGYHTSTAISDAFTVTNRQPIPYILTPKVTDWVAAGQSISLRGGGYDAEEGRLVDESLTWRVNGIAVGTGMEAAAFGLAPGQHGVSLIAQDGTGGTGQIDTTLTIAPLEIPESTSTPTLDGLCDDSAYITSKQLALAPYPDQAQATAQLIRRPDALWVCFSGLTQGASNLIGAVGVSLDPDGSGDNFAQTDDFGFFISEDGAPYTVRGDGSGGFDALGPFGLEGRVRASGLLWQAELKIPAAQFSGWEHALGLSISHNEVETNGDSYRWPYLSQTNAPISWAKTAGVLMPQLQVARPFSLTVGSPTTTITLIGSNFFSTTQALVNGHLLPTLVFSNTALSVDIPANLLSEAGLRQIQTVALSNTTFASNPVQIAVENPKPLLNQISPNQVVEEEAEFTLTVSGSGFRPDSVVLWHGTALPTVYVDTATLQAQVQAHHLAVAQTLEIEVYSPEPGGGLSTASEFIITAGDPISPTESIFLPIVLKTWAQN